MPPAREISSWNERRSDSQNEVEPSRKYVFICEGQGTENYYFKELIKNARQLKLHPLVDICQWEKTDGDAGRSDPKSLVLFAHKQKDRPELNYNRKLDRMVIVFDADKYCRVGEGRKGADECGRQYKELLSLKEEDDIYAVTNPSFELFLLLHKEDAYHEIVLPHEQKLLENRKDHKRRYAQVLFTDTFCINPKSNPKVGKLAHRIDTAILEEQNLNQNITLALDRLTSNVASTISEIRNDKLDIPVLRRSTQLVE